MVTLSKPVRFSFPCILKHKDYGEGIHPNGHEEVVRMHLTHVHNYAIDVKAMQTEMRLRRLLECGELTADGAEMTLTRITSALSHPAIGGYSVDFGDRLNNRLLRLLDSPSSEIREGAAGAAIEYAAVLASTFDMEIRTAARVAAWSLIDELIQRPVLGLAS